MLNLTMISKVFAFEFMCARHVKLLLTWDRSNSKSLMQWSNQSTLRKSSSVPHFNLVREAISLRLTTHILSSILSSICLIRGLLQTFFCPKKSSIYDFIHYDYFTDGASPISNCKYQTCLIFLTLDRAAHDVRPTMANESEQASPTGCCVPLLLKLGSHKHATKVECWERSPIFLFLNFVVPQSRKCGMRACRQRQLSSIYFSSRVTFGLARHCEVVPANNRCAVSQCSRII